MVLFGIKTELNWTKLFTKFKITEPTRTVCISNLTELFQTEPNSSEPNQTVIIGIVEKI